jgi:uncharacterized protein YuzB (UPF0349 family)
MKSVHNGQVLGGEKTNEKIKQIYAIIESLAKKLIQ